MSSKSSTFRLALISQSTFKVDFRETPFERRKATQKAINQQVFRFLRGRWLIDRQFGGSYCGVFKGVANFVPEPGAARCYQYAEQGELTVGAGQCFHAKQHYCYRLVGESIEVLKHEESNWVVMHQLDFALEDGIATASHLHRCGQDDYVTGYRIDLAGNWEVAYVVQGPKKDYRIDSLYSRCEPNAEATGSARLGG